MSLRSLSLERPHSVRRFSRCSHFKERFLEDEYEILERNWSKITGFRRARDDSMLHLSLWVRDHQSTVEECDHLLDVDEVCDMIKDRDISTSEEFGSAMARWTAVWGVGSWQTRC